MSKHSKIVVVVAPKLGTVIACKTTVERTGNKVRTTQQTERRTMATDR
jgi:hypothetical protein